MTSEDEPQGEEPEVHEAEVVFPNLEHHWKSKGQEVYCDTCPHRHAFNLPVGYHMTGIREDGLPQIECVFEIPPQGDSLEAVV